MNSKNKQVVVLGGGIAGISAALEIARCGIRVEIIEKEGFPGGHAVQFACKATDRCVSCGACIIAEKLDSAFSHPLIRITSNSRLAGLSSASPLIAEIRTDPQPIASEKCDRCGLCIEKCPQPGAVLPGFSSNHTPLITAECAYLKERSCTLCQELCPKAAIDLQQEGSQRSLQTDAIVIATGFHPVSPEGKPYGYLRFKDVLTGLDLERMLKQQGAVRRPSDGVLPHKIAFIQCVGSREMKQNRLWCSQVCCAAALRQALLLKKQQPEIQISFFYIDIQTFGRNFDLHWRELPQQIDLVRAIPGDISGTDDNRLRLSFFDSRCRLQTEEIFDLVVLSIGMEPGLDTHELANLLELDLTKSGFFPEVDSAESAVARGIFAAGTACGPMSIAGSVAHAVQTAWKTVQFLKR